MIIWSRHWGVPYINQFTQNIDRMIKQLQIEHLSYISVLQSEGLS